MDKTLRKSRFYKPAKTLEEMAKWRRDNRHDSCTPPIRRKDNN